MVLIIVGVASVALAFALDDASKVALHLLPDWLGLRDVASGESRIRNVGGIVTCLAMTLAPLALRSLLPGVRNVPSANFMAYSWMWTTLCTLAAWPAFFAALTSRAIGGLFADGTLSYDLALYLGSALLVLLCLVTPIWTWATSAQGRFPPTGVAFWSRMGLAISVVVVLPICIGVLVYQIVPTTEDTGRSPPLVMNARTCTVEIASDRWVVCRLLMLNVRRSAIVVSNASAKLELLALDRPASRGGLRPADSWSGLFRDETSPLPRLVQSGSELQLTLRVSLTAERCRELAKQVAQDPYAYSISASIETHRRFLVSPDTSTALDLGPLHSLPQFEDNKVQIDVPVLLEVPKGPFPSGFDCSP